MSPCRWDFISENRADFGVKRICRVLAVSRSGYYRHLATAQSRAESQAEEKRTVGEIRAVHAEHRGAYGAPRIHAELRARGRRINRKRVTRLMRVNHIVGRHLSKKKRTTIADRTAPPAPDLVMRDFTADTLNSRWCGDITYIPVGATWLYLATVIDICSRKVVGWSIADHMRTSLVTYAIEMAVAARGGPVNGVVFHTDRAPNTMRPSSPTSATGTASAAAWAGSARATTMPSPSRSSKASNESCYTDAAGPRRRRPGSSCSTGCRTTTGVAATPPSVTAHQLSSNKNSPHHIRCHSSHQTRCPLPRLSLSLVLARDNIVELPPRTADSPATARRSPR